MKSIITTVEMNLVIVNKDIATFNINGAISGVVHLPSSGPVNIKGCNIFIYDNQVHFYGCDN